MRVARALALAAMIAAPLGAWPPGAGPSGRMRLEFVVDDGVLIHAVCNHGALDSADAAASRAVVDLQNRMWLESNASYDLLRGRWSPGLLSSSGATAIATGLGAFLSAVQATPEFRVVREQSERRRAFCEAEWEADRERSERFVRELTGLTPRGDYRVVVLHPALSGGENMGHQVIRWGGREDWPHYTTVYMWHEVLHDALPRDDLGHVLVQLATDHELRCFLDPGADRNAYVGHAFLADLTRRVMPHWERYRRERRGDLRALYAQLAALHLGGQGRGDTGLSLQLGPEGVEDER